MRETGARGLDVRLLQDAPIRLDVTLRCGPRELLALVGPSGSGKTTVLRAIAGLVTPVAGRIVCDDETWLDREAGQNEPPQSRRVGLVFQDYALFPHLSALDNVAIAIEAGPVSEKLAAARNLLARVNLTGLEDRRPAKLSGGQQQRVAIARALAREPRVLLLDEPFSAVDQMTRERLKRELAVLRRSLGCPIIMVTHDLEEALALADRIAVLHHGTTLQEGVPDDVRQRPKSATVARLMGQSNVFAGRLVQAASDGAPGRLAFAGTDLEIARTGQRKSGEMVQWMIPSEAIVLHRRGRPSQGERENPLPGIAEDVTRLGDQTAVTVRLLGAPDAMLNFTLPTHAARRNDLTPGVEVTVSLLAESLHLFEAE
jgi:molybdate transport system ATP-binding protein